MNAVKINKIKILISFIIFLCFFSCRNNQNKVFEDNNSNNNHSLDLIIISDLHYFAPELGAGEPAFYRDKWTESKLTEHSK